MWLWDECKLSQYSYYCVLPIGGAWFSCTLDTPTGNYLSGLAPMHIFFGKCKICIPISETCILNLFYVFINLIYSNRTVSISHKNTLIEQSLQIVTLLLTSAILYLNKISNNQIHIMEWPYQLLRLRLLCKSQMPVFKVFY